MADPLTEARLSALEMQMQQLGQNPQGVDESINANYMTIDPATGQIGALFSGGVTIPESPAGAPSVTNSFNFTAAGNIVEYFLGYKSGLDHVAILQAADNAASPNHFAFLDAIAGAGGIGSSYTEATAQDGGTEVTVRLIDSASQSSFIQQLDTNVQLFRISRVSKANLSASYAFPSATWNLITLNTIVFGGTAPNVAFSPSTHLFTIPVAGIYHITGTLNMTNNIGSANGLGTGIWLNGSIYSNLATDSYGIANTASWVKTFADTLSLNANDTVGLAGWASAIAGLGVSVNTGSQMSVQLVG
jgi:hypothetical protein